MQQPTVADATASPTIGKAAAVSRDDLRLDDQLAELRVTAVRACMAVDRLAQQLEALEQQIGATR